MKRCSPERASFLLAAVAATLCIFDVDAAARVDSVLAEASCVQNDGRALKLRLIERAKGDYWDRERPKRLGRMLRSMGSFRPVGIEALSLAGNEVGLRSRWRAKEEGNNDPA